MRAMMRDGEGDSYKGARGRVGHEEFERTAKTGQVDVNEALDGGRGNGNVGDVYKGGVLGKACDAHGCGRYQVGLEEYWLLNIAASYEVSPGLEIYGRVENALDESYQQIFGYEMAGVAAYAGMRFQLEERVSVFQVAE